MNNSTIQAIEENIREARKIVELGNALERLMSNRDFKQVVKEGYFEQEAIRLVHLKADPSFQSADMQKSIVTQIDAIGAVTQYFNTVLHRAGQAEKAIEADEEARDELLAEDLTNV
jgi:CHAT domain-containing protein